MSRSKPSRVHFPPPDPYPLLGVEHLELKAEIDCLTWKGAGYAGGAVAVTKDPMRITARCRSEGAKVEAFEPMPFEEEITKKREKRCGLMGLKVTTKLEKGTKR